MLEDSIFTNRVTKEQLSKKFPNKVNIGFGLDANKIKGVDNFPIYNEAVEFNSNARSNIDTYMFTSRQRKYDVVVPKHTSSVGEIQPYYYNKHKDSLSTESNIWMEPGKMSSLYGLPPDKDIIIENPTAQAMNLMGGQMTEEKMMNHIARKEVSSTASGSSSDFFNDPRLISIIEGSTPVVDDSVPMQETSEPTEPERVQKTARPAARQEDEIIVEPAFKKGIQTEPENKSVHNEPENKKKNSRPEDDEVVAMKKKNPMLISISVNQVKRISKNY